MLSPMRWLRWAFLSRGLQELSQLVEVDVAGRPGGAVSLAVGMASIFAALPGMSGLMAYWYQFALVFEALVHFDDDRYGHARGALSHSGNGWAGVCSVAADELVARRAGEQRADRGSLGLFHRHRQHLDDLADVRRSESVARHPGALHRDDGADQDVEGAISVGNGGADVLRRLDYADRVL